MWLEHQLGARQVTSFNAPFSLTAPGIVSRKFAFGADLTLEVELKLTCPQLKVLILDTGDIGEDSPKPTQHSPKPTQHLWDSCKDLSTSKPGLADGARRM